MNRKIGWVSFLCAMVAVMIFASTTFAWEPKGIIFGTVIDGKGQPVVAEVLVEGEGFTATIITKDNGQYKIRRVPVGEYKITVDPQDATSLFGSDRFGVNVIKRKTTTVNFTLSDRIPDHAEYVGSAACKMCHGSRHAEWVKSAHANTHQVPSPESIVMPFDDVERFTSKSDVKFRTFIEGETYKVELFDLNDDSISVIYDVERTHGGVAKKGKQRLHVKFGDSHYILPIQYNHRNVDADNPEGAWVSYHSERWYNEDGTLRVPDSNKRSWEQNCAGCHATGLSVVKTDNGFISDSTEVGISCEECHGPGSLHISTGGGNGNNIIAPQFLKAEDANNVCNQCHTRVVSKPGQFGADFETGYPAIVDVDEIVPYVVGEDLTKYYSLVKLGGKDTPGYWNDDKLGSDNIHSKKHHQQHFDFSRSGHVDVGMKCFDCHTSHETKIDNQLRVSNDNNEMCLSCHAEYEDENNGINLHTKHIWDPAGSGQSRCSGCHMPDTAKTAVYTDISSHVFDIIKPEVSLAMAEKNTAEGAKNSTSTVINNSCFGCHPDDDYGVMRWNGWEGKVVE